MSEDIRRAAERVLAQGNFDQDQLRHQVTHWLGRGWTDASAEALLDLASALWKNGGDGIASTIYERCSELQAFPALRSRALLGCGIVAARAQDYETADRQMELSISAALEIKDYSQVVRVRLNQLNMRREQCAWPELVRLARRGAHVGNGIIVDVIMNAARMLSDAERYADAIAVLAEAPGLLESDYAPPQVKTQWLLLLLENLRLCGDDYLIKSYCLRALELGRNSGLVTTVHPEQHSTYIDLYRLLAQIYRALDDDPTLHSTALEAIETVREMESTSPLKIQLMSFEAERHEQEAIRELAMIESRSQRSYHNGLGMSSAARPMPSHSSSTMASELVQRLGGLRRDAREKTVVFDSALQPHGWRLAENSWPSGMAGLVYELDVEELVGSAYLVLPSARLEKFRFDVNVAAIRALLEVCRQGIEGELEFLATRLTEILLPPRLQDALARLDVEMLLLSPGSDLNDVPWEALGSEPLGLAFDLVVTPSLLRSSEGSRTRSCVRLELDRLVVVANPNGDLPHADREASGVESLWRRSNIGVQVLRSCTRAEFLEVIEGAKWIHYAGHANHLSADPGSSYVQLSDHLVTVRDIASRPILPDSVWVLNACEGAQTGARRDQGLGTGLSQMLLLKGASAVVAANWPIGGSDSADALLHFYRELERPDNSVARSMRNTRRALRQDGRRMHQWAQYRTLGHPKVCVSSSRSMRSAQDH